MAYSDNNTHRPWWQHVAPAARTAADIINNEEKTQAAASGAPIVTDLGKDNSTSVNTPTNAQLGTATSTTGQSTDNSKGNKATGKDTQSATDSKLPQNPDYKAPELYLQQAEVPEFKPRYQPYEFKPWEAPKMADSSGIRKTYAEQQELYKPLTRDEIDRMRRRNARESLIYGIGDAARAIANLGSTAAYAPNMYDHSTNMSDAAREHYERLKAEREAENQQFLNLALAQYQLDKDDANEMYKRYGDQRADEYNQQRARVLDQNAMIADQNDWRQGLDWETQYPWSRANARNAAVANAAAASNALMGSAEQQTQHEVKMQNPQKYLIDPLDEQLKQGQLNNAQLQANINHTNKSTSLLGTHSGGGGGHRGGGGGRRYRGGGGGRGGSSSGFKLPDDKTMRLFVEDDNAWYDFLDALEYPSDGNGLHRYTIYKAMLRGARTADRRQTVLNKMFSQGKNPKLLNNMIGYIWEYSAPFAPGVIDNRKSK